MARLTPRELGAHTCAGLLGRAVSRLLWDAPGLSWVDTGSGRVQTGRLTELGPRHTATLAVDGPAGAIVAARGGWVVGPDPVLLRRDGRVVALELPRAEGLWCDPAGRLWLDTGAALCRVDLGGAVHPVLPGPTVDLVWSPDTTTAYRACAQGLVAHAFDLANGTLGPGRPLVERATGAAVDADGNLWVADGTRVTGVDRAGAVHSVVRLGAAPVDCCLAGPTLLITATDGTVHTCRAAVPGPSPSRWTGPGR